MKKWDYTQRPKNERLFLASDMATALDITIPTFYSLIKTLNIEKQYEHDARGHVVLVFTHEALARCREELERRENLEKARREAGRQEIEAAQTEHPLVKDARCLKMSYWPDIVPVCFEELGE